MAFGFTAMLGLFIIVLIFVLSALPLHVAVKLLRGKTNIFKTIFITILTGIIVAAIKAYFSIWGSLIAFLILIWIYHEAFRLKWWKAFVAWFLQFVFILLFWIVAILISSIMLGISILL